MKAKEKDDQQMPDALSIDPKEFAKELSKQNTKAINDYIKNSLKP